MVAWAVMIADAELYSPLHDSMDYSPPSSSAHVFLARILERAAISSSGDLPELGIEPASLASPVGSLPPCHLGSPGSRWLGRIK